MAGAGLRRRGRGEEAIRLQSRPNGVHPWMDRTQGVGREDGVRGPDASLWVGGGAIDGDGETTGRMGLGVEVALCWGTAESTAAPPQGERMSQERTGLRAG